MTNNIAKIRAALEQEPGASRGQALAALAELERAAAQPAPKFEAPDVTRPMCRGAWARFWSESNSGDSCDQARRWLEAWRSELGPTLGLVGLREPSDAECAAIHKEWLNAHGIHGYGAVQNGRAMFAAVAAYLRGELK